MKKLMLGLVLIILVGCNGAKTDNTATESLLHYQCGNQPLDIRLNNSAQQVRVIIDGSEQLLHQVVSASGARYSNAYYTFWSKGDTAMILRGTTVILDDCKLVP